MFANLFRPKALPLPLRPVGGEFYAHVFENSRTGVSRDLFWNFSVELEPVVLDGEEWDCSFGAEWLCWPLEAWRNLDGMSLDEVKLPEIVEASLYLMAEHHPARLTKFRLSGREGTSFEATIEASAQVATDKGERAVTVVLTARLQFTGIIVVNNNIEPEPRAGTSAAAAVSQFIGLDGLRDPRFEGWRFVFEPIN